MKEDLELVIDQPVSIREKVYQRIKDMILNGRIAPSERIIENKIAKQLGVSRTPVREALHVLEREGFLEAIPRIGYKLKEIQWEEVVEIFEIWKVNEILAASWAIEKITPEELRSLEEILDAAEAEMKKGVPKQFIERDAEFHETLIRASGSLRLLEICQTLRRHLLLYRVSTMYEPESAERGIERHRRILERLKERDPTGLEEAIRDHHDNAKRDIRRYAFRDKGSQE